MSVQAISWVLEQCPREVGPQARCVLVSIANHADRRGENSWPGIETVAHESGLGERQVQRWVRWLELAGIVEVGLQEGGDDRWRGDRRPNRYRIVPMADGVSPTSPRPECAPKTRATTGPHRPPTERGVTGDTPSEPTGCHPGSNGVSSRVERGVSRDTPLEPTGCHPGSNGVSPKVERGVTGDTQSVLNRPEPSSSSSTDGTDARPVEEEDDFSAEVWRLIAQRRLDAAGPKTHPALWLAKVRENLPAEHGRQLAELRARFTDLTPSHAAAALEGDRHSLSYLTRAEP